MSDIILLYYQLTLLFKFLGYVRFFNFFNNNYYYLRENIYKKKFDAMNFGKGLL